MHGFKQFIEMPLQNYKVAPFEHPEVDTREPTKKTTLAFNYFNRLDRKLITLDRTQNCLKQALAKHGHDFNFILIEVKDWTTISGEYLKNVSNYMKENDIPQNGHITFATNSSTVEPLTCWMLLHKFGQALFKPYFITNKSQEQINNAKINLLRLIKEFSSDTNHDFKNIAKFMKFKSATRGKIETKDELIYDLVAEYLWNGKIRIEDQNDEKQVYFSTETSNIIKSALDASVGTILIDYFVD